MPKQFICWIYLLMVLLFSQCTIQKFFLGSISPNDYKGSDTERIQAAVNSARKTTHEVIIPKLNSNGSTIWQLDNAILLPGNMTLILDNCTIQLSDRCRDNMFRSDNVGVGRTQPQWNHNINIIGVGEVTLKGAKNPRSTGDSGRKLELNPSEAAAKGNWRVSYGSDAGKEGLKQTGDWRNIMILMAYVDGFKMKNLKIENSHAWAVSFERTKNAELSDIRIDNPEEITIEGKKVQASNKDGIDLRHGCKNFRIHNISGRTGDDFIALSSLDTGSELNDNGILNSTMVTTRKYRGPEDDTEQIEISNISCQTKYRGVAIRASDSASIHHIYIQDLITREWDGLTNAILLGGKGYGKLSLPGKINNIYGMNIIGEGRSLIFIEAPVSDCCFSNGIYKGSGDQIITYNIDKSETHNVVTQSLIKTNR